MQIPQEVQKIITSLQKAGFEAFAVGGCVRDTLLGRQPADWDVTTNATPEEIQKLFPHSFYANQFGTVTVLTGKTPSDSPLSGREGSRPDKGGKGWVSEIEVTTYRTDADYTDQRHPDTVHFTAKLEEDLARRDFTINSMAMVEATPPNLSSPEKEGVKNSAVIENLRIIDPFGGLKDLNAKLVRAVGDPKDRFAEDALRLLRAVRLAAQLNFTIEEKTLAAITQYAPSITAVSQERVRDELVKMVMSSHPEYGFNLLRQTGLLAIVLPEVAEGVGVGQNKHHIYTVFDHNVKSLQYAAQFGYPLHVRLAALWHDIGKPRTKKLAGLDYTFHAHDIVGARMTEKLMKRLRFSNALIEQVVHLVRHHMFYYDVGKVTEAGARRLLRRVGKDQFADLIKLRIAERKGSGVPKAEPYRLRHLQFLVEKAAQEPITTNHLKIGGNDLMKELALRPSPQIGGILNALLAEVLDDPAKNTREHLLKRAHELKDKDSSELKALGEAAKDAAEQAREDDIRKKYHV
jgi:tRNA nucleotidyltransferase (CCA-adding enzyme)